MYRVPAPRPFDDRKIRGWGRALRAARPRRHTFRRYNGAWLALPFVLAAASLGLVLEMPSSMELSCTRPAAGAAAGRGECLLHRHHRLGWTTTEKLAQVSGHAEVTLGADDAPGPMVLLQTASGPLWLEHSDSVAIGDAAQAVMYGEGTPPPVDVTFDSSIASNLGLFLFTLFVMGGLAAARVRTVLTAYPSRGELSVRSRGIRRSSAVRLDLTDLGPLEVESVDDSDFMLLRIGSRGGAVLIGTNGACVAAREFLREVSREDAERDEAARSGRAAAPPVDA